MWHGRECWGDAWKEMGTRSAQEENWRDPVSFSTDFLSLEGVNIFYSKGFEGCFTVVPFSGKLEKINPSDSQ